MSWCCGCRRSYADGWGFGGVPKVAGGNYGFNRLFKNLRIKYLIFLDLFNNFRVDRLNEGEFPRLVVGVYL